MNILCTGLSHHTAPVEVRERFSISEPKLEQVLSSVRNLDGVKEAVILSTCNRVEFYTATVCPSLAADQLRQLMSAHGGDDPPLYVRESPWSIRHLYRVACGIDSMVVGETEILGQMKKAYASAHGLGSTGKHLNKLFQNAFRVAKTIRTQTRITQGPVSVGSVAVELAGKIFGNLKGKQVMILGAGETSERVARSLQSRGIQSVIVSNRTFDRAAKLAGEIGGMAIHFDHWENAFAGVDILISSTSAPHLILTPERLAPLMRLRRGRPLFVIDLAVPRDADPSLNELEGVFLYDIDSLQQIADQSMSSRKKEIERCELLIDEQVGDYLTWMRRQQGDQDHDDDSFSPVVQA